MRHVRDERQCRARDEDIRPRRGDPLCPRPASGRAHCRAPWAELHALAGLLPDARAAFRGGDRGRARGASGRGRARAPRVREGRARRLYRDLYRAQL